MRPVAAISIVTLALSVLGIVPARADTPKCGESQSGPDAGECSAGVIYYQAPNGSEIQNLPTPRTVVTSSGSSPPLVPYNRLSTGPDGQPCATTGYVQPNTTPPDERLLVDPNPRETNIPIYGSDLKILEDYPPCPAQPRAPGEPAPVETPSMIAARYWEQIPLPKPKPTIAPGRAITGKTAYLETKGETTHLYSNSTLVGPLQIQATGTYTIDWGDGTTTGPHSFEGQPWPDGKITHEYTKVGTYNVVVTEKWTAHWDLGGQSGTLRTLQTTGRIDNFPVQQIQAVIGQ